LRESDRRLASLLPRTAWSTLALLKRTSSARANAPGLDRYLKEFGIALLQIEYAACALRRNILVDDVARSSPGHAPHRLGGEITCAGSASVHAVRRFRRVVTMSKKDAHLLPGALTRVIENGVDNALCGTRAAGQICSSSARSITSRMSMRSDSFVERSGR
jgi:hypothetical protein